MMHKNKAAAAPAGGAREGGRSARIHGIIDRVNKVAPGFLGNDAAEELAEWSDEALGDLENLAASLEKTPPAEPPGEEQTPPPAAAPQQPMNMAATVKDAATMKGGDVAKPKTVEEYLAEAPEEIRSVYASHKEQLRVRKVELVSGLKSAQKAYSEEELNAMTVEQLEKVQLLVSGSKPKNDFSGNGPARGQDNGEEGKIPSPPSLATRVLALRGNKQAS